MNNIGKDYFDIGYMDTLSSKDSILHRLDPRAKLIIFLVFLVVIVSFNKYTLLEFIPFFIFPAVMISLGDLPAWYFIKKVLLILPLAVVIGIFNPLIDRQNLFYLGSIGISGGWVSFISIVLRFVLTVGAALILIALTGFNAVCQSLSLLGVPRIFVSQLLFFYRYIFVLADEAERMLRAGFLRSVNFKPLPLKVFIMLTGSLLIRTLDRAERIYSAMLLRGFKGQFSTVQNMKFGYKEVFFIAGWSALFLFFRFNNPALKAGLFITGVLK